MTYFPSSPFEKKTSLQAQKLINKYKCEDWLRFVPSQSPRRHCPSPVKGCGYNMEWLWNEDEPDQIRCKQSGVLFPNFEYKPQIMKVKVLSGENVEIPWWQSENIKQTKNGITLVQARIDCAKRDFLVQNLPMLSTLYETTKDEKIAEIIVTALDAWADFVPHYYMTIGFNTQMPIGCDEAENIEWKVERVSTHNGLAHELPPSIVNAFDRIYHSNVFETVSNKKGYDVRKHIQKDFFENIINFLIQKPPMETHISTNLSNSYLSMAKYAVITGNMDIIKWLDRYISCTIKRNFMQDGMYPESFLYHKQYAIANYEIVRTMKLYFNRNCDLQDEMKVISGNLDENISFLYKAAHAQDIVSYPDGDLPPFGDTSTMIMVNYLNMLNLYQGECLPKCDSLEGGTLPRRETVSQLLPCYGHLTLGDGTDDKQVQINMSFNDYANHCHHDTLGYTLYAFGKEIIGDIRYSKIPGRGYCISTLSHNTVVVDKASQYSGERQLFGNKNHVFTKGNLNLFIPNFEGISLSCIDAPYAYPGKVSIYRRMQILNATNIECPYILDVFLVKGGAIHDYVIHGSTRIDQEAFCNQTLMDINRDYPMLEDGEVWTEPEHESDERNWYGMLRDMKRGEISPNCCVDYKSTGKENPSVCFHFLMDSNYEIFLGESPSPYRNGTPETFYEYKRPSLLVRHKDDKGEGLESVFISVAEPYCKDKSIKRVERIPLKNGRLGQCAIKVEFNDGRKDICLINLNDDTRTVSTHDAGYFLDGRAGIYSENCQYAKMYLVSGSCFKYDGGNLNAQVSSYQGRIIGNYNKDGAASNDILVADIILPEGEALKGKCINLAFEKYSVIPDKLGSFPQNITEQNNIGMMYQIRSIDVMGQKSYIHLENSHFLNMQDNGIVEMLRPHRLFKGECSFKIDLAHYSETTDVKKY